MRRRFLRHYCINCHRPIFHYRPGYLRCRSCYNKMRYDVRHPHDYNLKNIQISKPIEKGFFSRFYESIKDILGKIFGVIMAVIAFTLITTLYLLFISQGTILNEFGGANQVYHEIMSTNISYIIKNVDTLITGPTINDTWVHNFISIVNNQRTKQGLPFLEESNELSKVSKTRFNQMMENPVISHYGATDYLEESAIGEVVLYPEGYTEQGYVNYMQEKAPLHWHGLMLPETSYYGYYIQEGLVIASSTPCPLGEIPGPNINVIDLYKQHGCTPTTSSTIWLVINVAI